MCLCKKPGPPKVAEEDITCYKVVERHKNDGKLTSYYQTSPIVPGTMMVPNEKIDISEMSVQHRVCGGAIHAYHDCSFSIELMRHWFVWGSKDTELVLLKCVIPKGTPYFVNDGEPVLMLSEESRITQYAALQIMPVEVIRVYDIKDYGVPYFAL